MWRLFDSKVSLSSILVDYYDIHSHLLPAVDDGSKRNSDSVKMLSMLKEAKVSGIGLTPHIMSDIYPANTKENLEKKFNAFLKDNASVIDGLDIMLAAEYLIDDKFGEYISTGMLEFKGGHVLVEFSMMGFPANVLDRIFPLSLSGRTPILAHPERYLYATGEIETLLRMKEMGCCFQLNMLSLTGFYGQTVARIAKRYLDEDLYDFIGSDIHSTHHIKQILNASVSRKYYAKMQYLANQNRLLFR